METIILRRDAELFKKQVIGGLIFLLGSAIALQLIISMALSWAPVTEKVMSVLVWLTLPVLALVLYITIRIDWKSRYYEISDEAIVIHKKLGLFGNTESVYRYESMISIRMEQNYFGKKWGYGDIRITIPKLEKQVVLRNISNPSQHLAEIQKRLNSNSVPTHSLIT